MTRPLELAMALLAVCPVPPAPHDVDVLSWAASVTGFGAQQWALLLAACIAAGGVAATIITTSLRARRDRLTDLYADALSGVADYNEGPYRIRRRDGNADQRFDITTKLSDTKSGIDHSQTLLRLHARPGVAGAYDAYVRASQVEAGGQMQTAWAMPPVTTDDEVNLYKPYSRVHSTPFRERVIAVMQADLAYRRWSPGRRKAFRTATAAARAAAPTAGDLPLQPGIQAGGTAADADSS